MSSEKETALGLPQPRVMFFAWYKRLECEWNAELQNFEAGS